jgi:septum formation protein
MNPGQPHLYLASHSPRRRELLRQINLRFETLLLRSDRVRGSDVEEVPQPGEAAVDYVTRIARAKAEAGAMRARQRAMSAGVVLAADTEVIIDDEPLGKPRDAEAAAQMLQRLSGRSHEVLSAVAVARSESLIDLRLSRSLVEIRPLTAAEIRRYVASGEPLDKAGGYAVQGMGAMFISRLEGSYSGVMGLPLFETVELLRAAGFSLP